MSKHIGSFTPSHTSTIDLISRKDGDFDTPVDIQFTDPEGKIWTAPAGTITDGASIPSLLAGFFGGKLNKNHLFAAIVHDAYCGQANAGGPSYQIERWQDTHRMFHKACIANGTRRVKANTMYAGVRLGGPRWPFNGESPNDLSRVDDSAIQAEMKYCQEWIESQGESLSLDEIDQWMDEREPFLLEHSK
ncbi:MAG: DUF1353 domain-containing protein [Bacteroidota bacterium]